MNNNFTDPALPKLIEQLADSSFGAFIFNTGMQVVWMNETAEKTCPSLSEPGAFKACCVTGNAKDILSDLQNNVPYTVTFEVPQMKPVQILLMPSGLLVDDKDLFIGILTPGAHNHLLAYDDTSFSAITTVFRETLAVSFANIYNLRRKGMLLKDSSDVQYADVLYRNCCSMFRAVQNISSYYKTVNGLLTLNKSFGNLNKFLSELCQSVMSTYTENLRIELSLPPKNILCCFDGEKLATVLLNLISNSCLYNEREVPAIQIILKHTGKGSYITVKDDGVGVPESLTEEIFLPFVSYSPKREKPYRLGLGLTLCKVLVLAHQGTITLKSKEGKGTEVTIFLPSLPDDGIGGFASTPVLNYADNQLSPVHIQLSDSFPNS